MPKPKLNYQDLSDQVQFVMKTRQDHDVTSGTNVIYAENEIKLLWQINLGTVCDTNQIRQQRDRSYRYGLCRN